MLRLSSLICSSFRDLLSPRLAGSLRFAGTSRENRSKNGAAAPKPPKPTRRSISLIELCKHGAVSEVVKEIRRHDREAATRLSLDAIISFQKCGHSDAALRIWDEFNLSTSVVSGSGFLRKFDFVLPLLSKAKRYTDAVQLFKELRLVGHVVDAYAYNSSVFSCLVLNDVAAAEAVADDAVAAGVRSASVWTPILDYFGGLQGDVAAVERLLEHMTSKGVALTDRCFNALLKALSRTGRDCAAAESVLNRMTKSGIPPTCVTYGLLVNVYAKAGDTSGAESVFKRMQDAGVSPDVLAFNALLSSYVSCGDSAGAESVRQRLVEAGLQPNDIFLTTLAALYRKSGSVDLLMGLLQSAAASGVSLSDALCSQLIGFYADRDDAAGIASAREWLHRLDGVEQGPLMFLAEAEMYHKRRRSDVLEQMGKDSLLRGWHRITGMVLSMQMDIYIDKRQFDAAVDAAERAARFRAEDATFASQLLRLYHLRGDELATVEDVFRRRIPDSARDVFAYSYMLEVYRQRGRGDKVEQLLREMIDRGMPLTPFTALTLLKQMVSDKQCHAALNTLLMLDQPVLAECFDVVEHALRDAGLAHQAAAVRVRRADFQRRGRIISLKDARRMGTKISLLEESVASASMVRRSGFMRERSEV